jgi:hypothetical protein
LRTSIIWYHAELTSRIAVFYSLGVIAQLLEQQPFADADASYFEEEKYGTVSALLGEGAKPFLGIPLGPLQIGHFTMSLGISLMAFVEYPGFPLTNLPTPIRDALQGGTSRQIVMFALWYCV